MKKIFLFAVIYLSYFQGVFAADNYLGISNSRLKNGNVHLDDIPNAIRSAIDFLMGIAGTIAVIFVIIGAYKILF